MFAFVINGFNCCCCHQHLCHFSALLLCFGQGLQSNHCPTLSIPQILWVSSICFWSYFCERLECQTKIWAQFHTWGTQLSRGCSSADVTALLHRLSIFVSLEEGLCINCLYFLCAWWFWFYVFICWYACVVPAGVSVPVLCLVLVGWFICGHQTTDFAAHHC